MSILYKAKRRFVFVCFITCVVLMTVSWHLLWQSFETTIIKTSQLKTVIEEPELTISRLQINKSDISYKSPYGTQNKTNNTLHSTIIPNDFKKILMKMTKMLENHQITKEEGKYLDILKNKLDRLPHDYRVTENSNIDKLIEFKKKLNLSLDIPHKILHNVSSSESQITFKNTNIHKTRSETLYIDKPLTEKFHHSDLASNHETLLHDGLYNSVKRTDINDTPPSNNINDKSEKNNHHNINFDMADNNNYAPLNPDINKENHDNQRRNTNLLYQLAHDRQTNNGADDNQGFISNHSNGQQVRKLTDISMIDLQNTWNKMKKKNTKYENSKRWIMIPQSVSTENQSSDDNTNDHGTTNRPDYCKGCFSYNFQPIIQPSQLCKSKNSIRLLMFISSAPDNREARVVIRKTWAAKCREPNSELKCVFVLGRSKNSSVNMNLIIENKTYGDLLQMDFQDSYSNLTYKTMSSFKWAGNYCSNARYVMKTDDDMYVNTELITQMLRAAPRVKFVGGYCWGNSRPNRDFSSKWFVSYRMFQKPRFPPMCSGTGYILSMDVVRRILVASHNVPFFHLEDVYVSLCLQKYGIMPNNLLGFSNMYTEFDACLYKNSVLTSHQIPSTMLEDFWPVIEECPPKNVSPMDLYIVLPYPLVE